MFDAIARTLLLFALTLLVLSTLARDAHADDVRLLLDRIQVVRERVAAGDRPYFATIAFRSRLNRRGSTSLRVIENEPHDWVAKPAWHRVHAGGHLQQGNAASIPPWMGGIEWRNVEIARFDAADPSTRDAAVSAEILGAIILALDNNNTPSHVFKDLLNSAVPKFRVVLRRHVESGRIVRDALGAGRFDPSAVEAEIETPLKDLLADQTTRDVDITIPRGVARADIQAIEIRTTLGGGSGGDNRNLARLRVVAAGDAGQSVLYDRQGKPLARFTGDRRNLRFAMPRA